LIIYKSKLKKASRRKMGKVTKSRYYVGLSCSIYKEGGGGAVLESECNLKSINFFLWLAPGYIEENFQQI
jgi:hypothetical protein